MAENQIEIQVGDKKFSYGLFSTEAPADYDGFGTFEIMKSGDMRYVLIRDLHEKWQIQRNGSGLYDTFVVNSPNILKAAQNKILDRIWLAKNNIILGEIIRFPLDSKVNHR